MRPRSLRTVIRGAPRRPAGSRIARRAILTMALVEGWRQLRHPVFLVAVVLAVWGSLAITLADQTRFAGEAPYLVQLAWSPLYMGTFLVAHAAASRHTSPRVVEAFAPQPMDSIARACGIVLAAAAPAGAAALLSVAQWTVLHVRGGLPVGSLTPQVIPWGVVDAVQVPVLTVMAAVAGVTFAVAGASRTVGVITGTVIAYPLLQLGWLVGSFPAHLLSPLSLPIQSHDLGPTLDPQERRDWPALAAPSGHDGQWQGLSHVPSASAAQNLYVLAITTILTWYVLHRMHQPTDPPIPSRPYFILGSALLGLGITLKWRAFGIPDHAW